MVDLAPVSQGRRHHNWRVTLQDDSVHLLRIAVGPDGAEGLERELAAQRRLAGAGFPIVERYELLPDDLFDRPASLSSWIHGSAGEGVVDVYPPLVADLCFTSGQLFRALEDETRGPWGTGVVDGRFVPLRTRWSAEYHAGICDGLERACAAGVHPGPLLQTRLERLRSLLPALDRTDHFALVHGDLRPANLILEVTPPEEKDGLPAYDLLGVVDWELAAMGDPLLAWGMALELPTMPLAHLIDGYGREAVEGWLRQPDVLARLEVYAIGRVVQFLALVVAGAPDEPARARGLAHAGRLLLERTPGFVAERLTEALAVDLQAVVDYEHPPLEVDALLQQVLGRLARVPALGVIELEAWLGALAAGLRDADHEDEGWARDGRRFLDEGLRPGTRRRGAEPIADRQGWLRGLDRRLGELDDPRASLVGWLVLRALEQLGHEGQWPVPDAVLRGVQSTVELLARREPSIGPRGALFDAVVALASEQGRARMRGRDVRREHQQAWLRRLREAWEDLTVFSGEQPAQLGPDGVRVAQPDDWRVPVLLLALEEIGRLPVETPALIGAICTGEA